MDAFVRFVVCGELAVIGHLILFVLIDRAEPREVVAPRPPVEIQLVRPPPPPPPAPPKPPEVAQPAPTKQVHEPRRSKPRAVRVADVAVDTPKPLDQATVPADTTTTPVFGVTMNSTSGPGSVAVKVGNTADPSAGGGPKGVKPLAEPAAAVDVTRMPIPRGRCTGKYTEAARAASLEGVVVLDLVVDDTGRSRDITVVAALGHGLTEAAIQAVRDCRFTPGQKSGKPVAVRVRGFKIRFLLDD